MDQQEKNVLNDQSLENVAGGRITEEEALAAALAHAKLEKEQVKWVKKIKLDYERGRMVYEVEFFHDGFDYEYDIDAETGKVLKFDKDWD